MQEANHIIPTTEELKKMLLKAGEEHDKKILSDPEYKKTWENMERALFGPTLKDQRTEK